MTVAYDVMSFKNPEEWEKWLRVHHTIVQGVWMKFAKKGSGIPSVYYQEALEVALCYGWIDGQAKTYDVNYYLQKFTPRAKRSMWSKRNRDIVARLIEEKRMQEAGFAEIERAKKDGRWEDAYDSPKDMHVPEDFIEELKKDPMAYEFFKTLNRTNTYAMAFRLNTAKKPETRERRKQVLLEMMRKKEKLY